MEQSNTRKAVYLGISLIVSLLIWFAVSGNAEVSIDVADVPVEFLNEATSLAEKGLMRIDTEVPTVDLTLRTTRSNVYKLDTDEIRLLADLGSVTAPGAQSINYSISFPPNVASSEVKIEYPAARTVIVNIGELFRKDVDVRCEVVGSVAEGYLAESVRLTPKTIEIRGQQEDIVNVNYAQVTLDVSGAKAMMELCEKLEHEGVDVSFCGVQENVKRYLDHAGVTELVGEDSFYWSADKAFAAICRSESVN
ncbi:MAG: STAS domain-containing protein, partial [Oscillospiraceae bacterium]|nr:STAS domain-containing protein [Oscillospiraceae bacterium]